MNTFSIKEIFKTAWTHTKLHIKFLAGSTFAFLVIYSLLSYERGGIAASILHVAAWVVALLFGIGMVRIGLLIESGGTPHISDFGSSVTLSLVIIWASIITGFFTFLGFVLFVIPGLIAVIRLSFVKYGIVHKQLSAWDATKESWKMTKGNIWKISGVLMLSILVMLVSIIPVGLGLVVAIPFVSLMYARMYKKILEAQIPIITQVSEEEPQVLEHVSEQVS